MSKQDRGEHSRSSEPSEGEKPLKKARYVWEVKGKYHLKETCKNNNSINENNNNTSSIQSNSVGTEETEVEQQMVSENNSAKPNNESCSCIESFLAKTEAIMDSDAEENDTKSDCDNSNVIIPVTLVAPRPRNQDYYLQKWQARQLARGFVDNTINSVLETWKGAPFDMSDFVENCTNDGQVEDDAILMAIQSHGLQSNSSRGNIEFLNGGTTGEDRDNANARICELEESTQDNIENCQTELNKEQQNNNSNNLDSMSCDSGNSNQSDLDMGDPMDFLSAAVSVAIQKKGLSYGY